MFQRKFNIQYIKVKRSLAWEEKVVQHAAEKLTDLIFLGFLKL